MDFTFETLVVDGKDTFLRISIGTQNHRLVMNIPAPELLDQDEFNWNAQKFAKWLEKLYLETLRTLERPLPTSLRTTWRIHKKGERYYIFFEVRTDKKIILELSMNDAAFVHRLRQNNVQMCLTMTCVTDIAEKVLKAFEAKIPKEDQKIATA